MGAERQVRIKRDARGAYAQWIDRATLIWDRTAIPGLSAEAPKSGHRYALEYAADVTADVAVDAVSNPISNATADIAADDPAAGPRAAIPLRVTGAGMPDRLRASHPHLGGRQVLEVCFRDVAELRAALTRALIATRRDESGRLVAATGVQTAGVIDDVYAAATGAGLGPTWQGSTPTLSVWAPTARAVQLRLFDSPAGGLHTCVPMLRDEVTGVWSVTGDQDWAGKYYTYLVTVYAPTAQAIVTNEVTDPYSVSLSADSTRSQLVSLADPVLAPGGWDTHRRPPPVRADQAVVYELHVRDFTVADPGVPEPLRGTFRAFTVSDCAGMQTLRELAADGLTHVQLMPVFDFASVPERRADWRVLAEDLTGFAPCSEQQQERLAELRDRDGYNWGYDPLHHTVPEGSYSTDPDGAARIRQFREMVAAFHGIGLRVVMDVVYNHSHAAGQDARSVLDRIVPGYYQRLLDDGGFATGTTCFDTAPEHAMMGKLVVDSVTTWAEQYGIDGFRFDLMGFHPKANILAVRAALDALTGIDGNSILLYGEGWDFGDVANDARFVQATQRNMAGTGVGTFNDRLRDAVRGGSLLDSDPRAQGFGSGLYTTANGAAINGNRAVQRARLARYQREIALGLTGNLASYRLAHATEETSPEQYVAYNAEPGEAITYVDCHDNETLFDTLAHKLPRGAPMSARVRHQVLCLAVVLLGQGAAFLLGGSERLRSKSLDRNSYHSGDWYNRMRWDCAEGNGFGAGLPPAPDNRALWPYDRVLLADPGLRPDCAAIETAYARFREFLRIRASTSAFCLGSADEIRRRVSFPALRDGTPGTLCMRIDTTGLDPRWNAVIVVFNATPYPHRQVIDVSGEATVRLHPVHATSVDPVMRQSAAKRTDSATAVLMVPARTVAVFVQTRPITSDRR